MIFHQRMFLNLSFLCKLDPAHIFYRLLWGMICYSVVRVHMGFCNRFSSLDVIRRGEGTQDLALHWVQENGPSLGFLLCHRLHMASRRTEYHLSMVVGLVKEVVVLWPLDVEEVLVHHCLDLDLWLIYFSSVFLAPTAIINSFSMTIKRWVHAFYIELQCKNLILDFLENFIVDKSTISHCFTLIDAVREKKPIKTV